MYTQQVTTNSLDSELTSEIVVGVVVLSAPNGGGGPPADLHVRSIRNHIQQINCESMYVAGKSVFHV